MEVCVDNVQSAVNAESGGAIRIELCTALSEGGLTPSIGFLHTVKNRISIQVFVMLRPRCGNFVYTTDEIECMKHDAIQLKTSGADGFVFGILEEDGSINVAACKEILSLVQPLPCTFHRAFDVATNPIQSLSSVIEMGFTRLLTSGQANLAEEGIDLIKELIRLANNKLIIVPGSGVGAHNVQKIISYTGAKEVHGSARTSVKLVFEGSRNVSFGTADDNEILVTDVNIVKTIVSVMDSLNRR